VITPGPDKTGEILFGDKKDPGSYCLKPWILCYSLTARPTGFAPVTLTGKLEIGHARILPVYAYGWLGQL
jgi:hypothetical protein